MTAATVPSMESLIERALYDLPQLFMLHTHTNVICVKHPSEALPYRVLVPKGKGWTLHPQGDDRVLYALLHLCRMEKVDVTLREQHGEPCTAMLLLKGSFNTA